MGYRMVNSKRLHTIEEIQENLEFCAETGILIWKERASGKGKNIFNSRFAGKPAGNLRSDGYLEISINSKRIKAHVAAWTIYYGAFPLQTIDHINGVRDDNRIDNLRDVAMAENNRNASISKRNRSGTPGVRWVEKQHKWVVQITKDRVQTYLGCFDCKEQAVAVRRQKESEFGFHKNHGKQ